MKNPNNYEPGYFPMLETCDASCAASLSVGDHWCATPEFKYQRWATRVLRLVREYAAGNYQPEVYYDLMSGAAAIARANCLRITP